MALSFKETRRPYTLNCTWAWILPFKTADRPTICSHPFSLCYCRVTSGDCCYDLALYKQKGIGLNWILRHYLLPLVAQRCTWGDVEEPSFLLEREKDCLLVVVGESHRFFGQVPVICALFVFTCIPTPLPQETTCGIILRHWWFWQSAAFHTFWMRPGWLQRDVCANLKKAAILHQKSKYFTCDIFPVYVH